MALFIRKILNSIEQIVFFMNSYATKYMITYKRSTETNKILTMFFQTLYSLLSSAISRSLGMGTGCPFVSISLFLLLKNRIRLRL